VQVDGGVSLENAKKLLSLGVTNLVVGSGISRAADPQAAFAAFENVESSYGI
jgi:thiamine monophosphate synthase